MWCIVVVFNFSSMYSSVWIYDSVFFVLLVDIGVSSFSCCREASVNILVPVCWCSYTLVYIRRLPKSTCSSYSLQLQQVVPKTFFKVVAPVYTPTSSLWVPVTPFSTHFGSLGRPPARICIFLCPGPFSEGWSLLCSCWWHTGNTRRLLPTGGALNQYLAGVGL